MAEISTAMVRIYKDLFGRGPTRTRSDLVGNDLLVCVLQDTLTTAEKSMVDMGEHDRLRELRLFFQYANAEVFRGEVERILGRKVMSFMSSIDTTTGDALEAFRLEPLAKAA